MPRLRTLWEQVILQSRLSAEQSHQLTNQSDSAEQEIHVKLLVEMYLFYFSMLVLVGDIIHIDHS